MIQSIRVLWRGLRWNQPINFNWPAITADSVVHISVSEAKRVYGMYFGAPVIDRFLGSATIEVRNVSPHAGGVTFFIYVDWDEELDVTTDITVFDPPVFVHDIGENQTWSVTSQALGTRSQEFITKNLSEAQQKQLQKLMFEDALVPQTGISGKTLALKGVQKSSRPLKTTAKKKN